jgi:hypothetical protein
VRGGEPTTLSVVREGETLELSIPR